MWRAILATLLFLLCGSADTRQLLHGSGAGTAAPAFTPQWQTLSLGGGGQLSGYDAHSDGTLLGWNNTYGIHLYKTSGSCSGWGTTYAAPCWKQLFTATSVTPGLAFPNGVNGGGIAAAACDSNTNVAYALWNGFLWVTQNLKAAQPTWLKTTLTTTQNPNDNNLIGRGRYLACDPNNPDIAYIATPTSLQVTKNGTSGTPTFATVTGVGTTGTIPSAIAFDPASATTGSCPASCFTNHLWVFTSGTGVYETLSGGTPQSGTFTLTTSGPTVFYGVTASKFSELWVCNGTATVYKYVNGAGWTTFTANVVNTNVMACAVDPTSTSAGTERIVAIGFDGSPSISTTGGSSFSNAGPGETVTAAAPQPTWMATANQGSPQLNLSIVNLQFDFAGTLWGAGGIANWKLTAGNIVINPVWAADIIGVEQLVAIGITAPAGGSPVTWQWDRGFFTIKNLDVFPSTYWPGAITSNAFGSVGAIMDGWALDYASSNTNFLTGWLGRQGLAPASSSDGGNTWNLWPSFPTPDNIGGAIAASTPTNWLLIAGINEVMSYTTDGGTTWNPSTVAGSPSWVGNPGVRIPIAADRVNANTFCAIDLAQNVYSSVDGGANLIKRINAGVLDGVANVDMIIAVPGQPDFFYTGSGSSGSSAGTNRLWKITKTTNECDTAAVPNSNLTGVYAFGFGAPKPGNSYPTIYAYGLLSGVLGVYESDDIAVTWTLINAPASQQVWPKNSQDFVTYISGDMNVYGVVYAPFRGSGDGYIQTQNACPYVNFSNINPTATVSGTMSLAAQKSGLVPVTSVDFFVDGSLIGTQTTPAGTPPTYTQSWNTTGLAAGPHNLTVRAVGNGCTVNSNSFTIPVTK